VAVLAVNPVAAAVGLAGYLHLQFLCLLVRHTQLQLGLVALVEPVVLEHLEQIVQ